MTTPEQLAALGIEPSARVCNDPVYFDHAVLAAILAERQRCADVARRFVGYTESSAGSAHSAESKKLAEDAADWIATSIMHPTL